MHFNRTALVALLIAAAGCSGSHANGTNGQSSGQQTAGQSTTAENPANLPLYPGAARLSMQMSRPVKACGTTARMTIYTVKDVDSATVSKWYDQQIANGIHLTDNGQVQSKYGAATHSVIFKPDGTGSVVLVQMQFTSPHIATIAKTLGANRTTIAIENFDPPVPREIMAMLQKGNQGDAASKDAAREQIKEKCGAMFPRIAG